MTRVEHWENVYRRKPADGVSWYAPHLNRSLEFVQRTGVTPTSAIVDVGAGASTLADDLIAAGFENVAVMDLSFVGTSFRLLVHAEESHQTPFGTEQ